MKQILTYSCIVLALVACDKDKFETKPKLEVESLSTDFVPRNQDLRITLSFTDKEGDVDDSLYVIRTRTNKRGPFTPVNPSRYKIPEFPNQSEGEIELTLPYSLGLTSGFSSVIAPGNPPTREPDTLILKFVLKDKAKNVSDTATANVIVERF